MNYGIYTSGLGAFAQSAKLDIIANNLANVNTPGFRKDQIAFRERLVEAMEGRHDSSYYNEAIDRYGGAPLIDAVSFDRDPGQYDVTGRAQDVAIDGKGFFVVTDRQTSENFYTRAGNFVFDAEGRLVTADGKYQVAGAAGEPIAIDPGSAGNLQIREDGSIYSGENLMGAIGVVDFDDYSALAKYGDTMFRRVADQEGNVAPHAAEQAKVRQGVIERSSVNPVVEMTEMIETLRMIESNLQMIKFQDSTLEKAVNELGRIPR